LQRLDANTALMLHYYNNKKPKNKLMFLYFVFFGNKFEQDTICMP